MYETEKRVLPNEAQNPDPAYDSFAICLYYMLYNGTFFTDTYFLIYWRNNGGRPYTT
jgi:hypothetical protein